VLVPFLPWFFMGCPHGDQEGQKSGNPEYKKRPPHDALLPSLMKARLIRGDIPGITRGHELLGTGWLEPETGRRASGVGGNRKGLGRRRRTRRQRTVQGKSCDRSDRLYGLLLGEVTLDEQAALPPLVQGACQVMNEVGWQDDQVDAEYPDNGPRNRAPGSRAKTPKPGLEVQVDDCPDRDQESCG
jgi:hypothetical protein